MTDVAEEPVAADDESEAESEVLGPSTSDAALTFEEARELTGRRGGRVALFMGEVGSGKTTLLVELWTDLLLKGSLGGIHFGGSSTSLAFEERSFESRLHSGLKTPYTLRTNEEDDGFLHLRVKPAEGDVIETFLADYTGEHFRAVREGTLLLDELPWIARVDRFAVVVDGAALADPGRHEVVLNRATRLLRTLRDSGATAASSRVAIVLTKDDTLSPEQRADYAAAEQSLRDLASEIDPEAVAFRVAARPADTTAPSGLDIFLSWLVCDDREIPTRAPVAIAPARSVGRFHA